MSTTEDAGIVFGPEYICPECNVTICQNSKDLKNWEVPTPCWTCRETEERKVKKKQK